MIGLIILAAGESSRLGIPKQTLKLGDKTLIQHAVSMAVQSVCQPVVLVLGANYETILPEVQHEPVTIINNINWKEGIGTSIRAGVKVLQENNEVEAAIIMLCDQPYADTALINKIAEQYRSKKSDVIASEYGGTTGVPALFNRSYFSKLMELEGNEGAKKLLSEKNQIVTVKFPLGVVDIDTTADFEAVKKDKPIT